MGIYLFYLILSKSTCYFILNLKSYIYFIIYIKDLIEDMNTLNKVTAVTVKLIIFLVGLSIAIVPIVYIIGTEPLHTQ